MTTVLMFSLVDAVAHACGELAGRQLGGVDLLDDQRAGVAHAPPGRCPVPGRASNSRPSSSSKTNMRGLLAACDGRVHEVQREQRLAGARRAQDQGAGAALDAAAQQRVELRRRRCDMQVAANGLRCSAATRRGKTCTPPVFDGEIVVAAAEAPGRDISSTRSAPPLGAIFGRQLLQPDHAVGDAVHASCRWLSVVRSSSISTVASCCAK